MRCRLTVLFLLSVFIINAQQIDMSYLKNLNIRNVGPANMSGRITAIDVVSNDPNIIFLGAASGGVWKSENEGSAWTPVFDDQPTQNIGAIAIHQSNPNIIWVGTGEGNPRNSMNLGMGIFKSNDGGNTWNCLGLEKTKTIHQIITHPTDSNIVYVGAMGDPFTPDENRGLFKSTDGGKSWAKILYTNDQSGIADIVMDPSNPNKLIAALYQHRRTPFYFTSGGPGSGLYISTNGGELWDKLSESNGLPSGELGRIGLAIAPSNPNRVYAKIEAEKNALYRSDDGGSSWKMINNEPKFTNNRPFYFQELAVDSKDENRLYNIYQPLSVSYDGGQSFDPEPMIPADETKGIHADFHAFWMNPNDPKNFIIGGDGGIGITRDHGKSWYFPETIPVAQFYHINVDNDVPYNVYGGMQDNGNWSGPGYTWKRGGIRTLYWQYLVGGDGFYIEPDANNSRFGYGTSQNGDLYRYDKTSGYYSSIKPRQSDGNQLLRFNWNAAFAKDPFDDESIYYGSQFVHRSIDKGANWEIISPDLSTNNPEHQKGDYGGLTLDISGAENYNSILSIAPSALDKNIIWAGTDDGQLHLTIDGGKTWNDITVNVTGMPKGAWIARIKASKKQKGAALMVVNNYRKGDYKPYLFRTKNYGKSWEQLLNTSNVQGYALSVIQDTVEPNLVFLGTENGLWISIDEGKSWVQFKNGFPSVSTMDLKIQERESALIVGTFGRAIWVLDDLLALREIARNRVDAKITALPMNEAVQVKGLFIAPAGNIWTGFHTTFEGENKVFQKVKIPYYINDELDTAQEVAANIFDLKDKLVNSIKNVPTAKGLNYLEWSLDEVLISLPGAWINDETRGTPVLPGDYKVVLEYKVVKDTTNFKVISDPRFDLDPKIDKELYEYRRLADEQIAIFSNALMTIDTKINMLLKLKERLEKNTNSNESTISKIEDITNKLRSLRSLGQTPKPDRQVGAWQTTKISPYSKVNDVQNIAMSRLRPISDQEQELLEEAKQMVKVFAKRTQNFIDKEWVEFEKGLNKMGIADE